MQTIRFLSAEDVKQALSMQDAIGLMKEAFVQLSSGEAAVPLRTSLDLPESQGGALFMPVHLPGTGQFGLKVVAVCPDNPAHNLPLIHALVMVFDAETGVPKAVLDGEYLTALRTGAASGLATDLLARKQAEVVAIFGAGKQSRSQLEAVCTVRAIKHAYIFDLNEQEENKFIDDMAWNLGISIEPGKASKLTEADVICTATTSASPVFSHANLNPGVHINAIGSYQPHVQEIPPETVVAAKLVVDQREACLSEAGDLLQPIKEGLIGEDHVWAEIGEIAAGDYSGRESDSDITLFKSVGNAVQDLAAANQVIRNAEKMQLGQDFQL